MTRSIAIRAAAGLLGAGCVVWSPAPLVHGSQANLALVLAICGVAGGALRLVLAEVPVPEDAFLRPGPVQAGFQFLETLRRVPWEEGAVLAILWLEVLHTSRPWHTALLGAALIAYLLATHLAESDASPAAGTGGRGPGGGERGAGSGKRGAGSASPESGSSRSSAPLGGRGGYPGAEHSDLVGIYKRGTGSQVFLGGWRLTAGLARREDGGSHQIFRRAGADG